MTSGTKHMGDSRGVAKALKCPCRGVLCQLNARGQFNTTSLYLTPTPVQILTTNMTELHSVMSGRPCKKPVETNNRS